MFYVFQQQSTLTFLDSKEHFHGFLFDISTEYGVRKWLQKEKTNQTNICHYCVVLFGGFHRKSSSDLVGLNLFHSPTHSNTSTPTGTVAAGCQSFGSMMSPTGTGSPSNRHNTATPGT